MSLTSGIYFVFLIAVFFIYWSIPDRRQLRILLLALLNYIFYAQAGVKPLLLLFGISTINYFANGMMAKSESRNARKFWLMLSLVIDVGALATFKYANFFLDSTATGLGWLGVHAPQWHINNLIAPLGISFYIFQSIAFVVDVYRKDAQPAQDLLEHICFVSFFPTLLAGPISRAKQLLPQLRERAPLNAEMGGQAFFLIAMGLIKKIAIADYLSANYVDRVFDFPERFSALEVLVAIYGYALQIYADFSGYSDIAIGSALLLGITVSVNFNMPYRSRDLAEFWRRWHITLSNWLRDYLFFSIAGPRARSIKVLYIATLITMLIGGLWHGATWAFVCWGLLHGIGLVILRVYEQLKKRWAFLPRNSRAWDIFSVILTFHFVCFAWIFFRAETIGQAFAVLKQLTQLTADHTNLGLPILLLVAIGLLCHWLPDRPWEAARKLFIKLPSPLQAALLFIIAIGLYFVASSDVVPFIYARF
jgi:D-alanyl-lipoteichoic acid acyltransferase DltB (MBOAT superfamily)